MITPASIKAAPVGAKLIDGTVPGLSLLVLPKRYSWYLYYRTKDRKERRPKLGDYPKPLGIKEARKLALDYLHDVAHGLDPVAVHKTMSEAPTVTELHTRYTKDHAAGKKTADEDERMWQLYVLPKWKHKRVCDLNYDDVYDIHSKMKDTPYQANRVLALISKALNLSERWGWRPLNSNPTRHIPRYREKKRKRYATPAECAAIARELDARAKKEPAGVSFIYLLILTGMRKGEVAGANWDMIVGDRLVIEEHKTDETGEARVIHLPRPVLEVLAQMPKVEDATITGILDPKKLWAAVRKAAGCPDLRMHDLRHSFASAALAAGYTLAQIGELLGHKSTQTTKRYAHLVDELAAAAASTTAERISLQMKGGVPQITSQRP